MGVLFFSENSFILSLEGLKVTIVRQQCSQQMLFNFSFQGAFETWVLRSQIKHSDLKDIDIRISVKICPHWYQHLEKMKLIASILIPKT